MLRQSPIPAHRILQIRLLSSRLVSQPDSPSARILGTSMSVAVNLISLFLKPQHSGKSHIHHHCSRVLAGILGTSTLSAALAVNWPHHFPQFQLHRDVNVPCLAGGDCLLDQGS